MTWRYKSDDESPRFSWVGRVVLSDLTPGRYSHSPLVGIVQVVELTEVAKEFLRVRFEEFDRDKDEILSPAEQDDMFSTSPSR